MTVSTDLQDPLPDLTAKEAESFSGELSRASVDLWSLCLYRRGYASHLQRIEEPCQLRQRMQRLGLALLDAAGWPSIPGSDDDVVDLAADDWEDADCVEE